MPARPASWRTLRDRYARFSREIAARVPPPVPVVDDRPPCPACNGEGMKFRDARKLRGTPCFSCNGSGRLTAPPSPE